MGEKLLDKKNFKKIKILSLGILIIINTLQITAFGRGKEVDYKGTTEISEIYSKYINETNINKNGLIPIISDIEVGEVSSSYDYNKSLIINKYDPRTLNKMTSVKDQGLYEVCWAFAGIATLESYLKLHDLGDYDLSEEHIRFWATINEKGYGWNREAKDGGPTQIVPGYFASSEGPKLEEDIPYNSNITDSLYKYNTVVDVTDIIYTDNNKEDVKKYILENGAVESCYYDDRQYLNNNSYYFGGDPSTYVNHAISIVGWDDSYSKDNFKDGDKPEEDGAWLIKNSWGTRQYDDGYMWISYEDKILLSGKNGNLNYSIKKANIINKYDKKKYQHDEYGAQANCNFTSGNNKVDTLYFANVFNFEEEYRVLDSVMFMTPGVGDKYSIFYEEMTGDNPSNDENEMILLKEGIVEFSGYMTIDVPKIKVKQGKGAIIVKIEDSIYEKGASIGCEARVSYINDNKVAYEPSANEGESYVMTSSEVQDMNGTEMKNSINYSPKNFSIKAITTKTEKSDTLTTSDSFEEYIKEVPDKNSKDYLKSINFLLEQYDNLSNKEKDKLSNKVVDYVEKVIYEESKKNHNLKEASIFNAAWNVKLSLTKLEEDDTSKKQILEKLSDKEEVIFYKVNYTDIVTNTPYKNNLQINFNLSNLKLGHKVITLSNNNISEIPIENILDKFVELNLYDNEIIGIVKDKEGEKDNNNNNTNPDTGDKILGPILFIILICSIFSICYSIKDKKIN